MTSDFDKVTEILKSQGYTETPVNYAESALGRYMDGLQWPHKWTNWTNLSIQNVTDHGRQETHFVSLVIDQTIQGIPPEFLVISAVATQLELDVFTQRNPLPQKVIVPSVLAEVFLRDIANRNALEYFKSIPLSPSEPDIRNLLRSMRKNEEPNPGSSG